MAGNFHEQFTPDDVPLPSDRSTGLVFAAVALIVALLWRSNTTVLFVALGICAAFVLLALAAPTLLRPLNIAWFKFAIVLNKIVSPVVMLVLFLITIVPFGLAMQLLRDPLRRRRPDDSESCWIERSETDQSSSMTNQF